MIPTFRLSNPDDRGRVEGLLRRLRLDPRDLVLGHQEEVASVQSILADVAKRGDAALVDISRRFDDPDFTAGQIRVRPEDMKGAASRVSAELLGALRRSITQVRQYQQHILPRPPETLR